MPILFPAFFVLALPQADTPPTLPTPKLPRIPLYGINVGTYSPASARVRARFGERWLSFSPGIGPVLPPPVPMLSPDFSLATQKKSVGTLNNRAFVATLGAQYQWPLFQLYVEEGKPFRLPKFLPYAGVSAGGLYANLRSEADGVNNSGFAPAVSAYVGTSIGLNGVFEARWRTLGKVRSFDLSGLDLRVGLRF